MRYRTSFCVEEVHMLWIHAHMHVQTGNQQSPSVPLNKCYYALMIMIIMASQMYVIKVD